ncbi:membrane cofactor protein-like [Molossus molossus]|uniref:membrane cofactor protein-like n=1 Tax=Molossus molossus TaxID=27622 RepID=UPI001746858D|nr:membrane cofactor protein-like [Molossus molossus]
MTASCEPRRAPPRRPESPFSSWCFVGIILVALVLRLPTSLGNCGKPPEYKSMQLNGTPKTSYLPGEKIFFECKPGYYYSNDYPLSTFCDQSNIWFLIDEACHRKKCPTPIVPNGETFDPQKGFEFAKEAHFYCNYGYYLKGEQILTCILSGDTVNWDHDIPTCEKILCKSPGKINNGKHTNNWRDVFEFNELVTYSCDHSKGAEEYSLVGESKLICSGPGKWSSDPPQCKVVQCEQPVIQHGRPLSEMKKIFSYLDEVLFECLKGFYLSGSNPVFCGGNSTWEPAVPTCIKDFKPPPPIKSSVSKFPGYSNLYEPSVEEIMEIGISLVINNYLL